MTISMKAGFFAISSCQGCLLSVLYSNILAISDAFEIVAFPFIKGKNSDSNLDFCFIEGTVVSKDDKETVKKLRAKSKIVVSLGTCATHGNIPALKNFVPKKNWEYLQYNKKSQLQDLDKAVPVHKIIPVDYYIPGCPPEPAEILRFIKDTLLGKKFRNYEDPVCRECKLFENGCLLDEGKICLGPLTRGGCYAICTDKGFECYGCRGLTKNANFKEYFKMMNKKGVSDREIKKRLETFMAIEVNERLKGTKWEKLH